VNGIFAHEFGHAIHYNQAGNTFWVDLIAAILRNGGYGTKTSTGHGHIAVAESWGYFIGATFNVIRYNSFSSISNLDRRFLENQRRDDSVPQQFTGGTYSFGWIPWGAMHDLIDNSEPAGTSIIDNVNGYSINGIFKGYTSNSTTVQGLKTAILTNNNNSQSTQVNTLITSYGW